MAGLALVPNDDREIVRGYHRTYELEDGNRSESPGYAVSRLLGSPVPTSTLRDERFLDFRYQFKISRASDVLSDSKSQSWRDIAIFKNQVVVIGGTYRTARDRHATPAGLLCGSQIVAQEAEAELSGTSIPSANRWLTGLLMVIGGLATVALYHWSSLRVAFLSSLLFIPLLSIVSNWILFRRFASWGAMVPLVSAVIVVELYTKASFYLSFYKKVSALRLQRLSDSEICEDSEAIPGPS